MSRDMLLVLLSAFLIFLAKCEKLYGELAAEISHADDTGGNTEYFNPDMATLAYASRKGRKCKASGVGIAKWERYDYVPAK
jgi:hypothetical protein